MIAELAVLYTNVLVNSVYDQAEHFAASRALLESAKSEDAGLCLLPQNVAEFYAAVTNAKRVSEPKPPEVALAAIDDFLALPGITLLPVPSDIVDRLLALLRRRRVSATKVYDLQLIAAPQRPRSSATRRRPPPPTQGLRWSGLRRYQERRWCCHLRMPGPSRCPHRRHPGK